jgi:cell division septum initiation protein DivIVA
MIDKLNPNLAQGTEADTGTTGLIPPKAEQRLKDDAGALLDTARAELAGLKDEATTQASAVADEAKAEIGKLADKAKGMAAEQKEFVAGQIGSVADAVQKVAGELEANDATTAGYARTIADTVTSFSDTVKNKDVDELLSMAEDFGKKQPVAFMGAAALLGFAASRFLLASANRRQPTPGMSSQYGSTGVGDGGPAATSYGTSSTSPRDTMGGTI